MLTLAATGFQQTTSEDVPYFLFKEYFRVNRKPNKMFYNYMASGDYNYVCNL